MEQSDVKQVTRDRKSEKLVRTPEEHVTFETVQSVAVAHVDQSMDEDDISKLIFSTIEEEYNRRCPQ